MRIVVAGPGRAGTALALAWSRAGHDLIAVVGRDREHAAGVAEAVDAAPLGADDRVPDADLVVVAVRDDDIAAVAGSLAHRIGRCGGAVHLSGLRSTSVLEAIASHGIPTGSFHPLQTIPTPEAGVARFAGCWVAVTADDSGLRAALDDLAADIGARPFPLDDAVKPLYHAAAAAAANFVLLPLAMASDLFRAAGVPWPAARPLVEAVVANAFDLGPAAALTGPVARGDTGTVAAQIRAVAADAPTWLDEFGALVRLVARMTGREPEFEDLDPWSDDGGR